MLEIFTTIALLCQLGTGVANIKANEKAQLSCQKYYIRCIDKQKVTVVERLHKCLISREIR